MLNNCNNNHCGSADEIVAYIYDEANVAERGKFETHLAGCAACTDEFASISAARYSVFEWRREEFDHLATPEIFIPLAGKVEENYTIGWPAGLKEFFIGARWPVTAFAAVSVILGMGFILMTYLDRPEQPIAANRTNPVVVDPVNASQPDAGQPVSKEVTISEKGPAETERRPVKGVQKTKPQKRTPTIREKPSQEYAVQSGEKPSSTKAPVLTNFEENEDRSLRLADLLGEGGVSQ